MPHKLIIFLWKICNNCLRVRAELHKRISHISPFCPLYLREKRNIGAFVFALPHGKGHLVWIWSKLKNWWLKSYWVNSIKDWIEDWLSKPELYQLEELWFYGQFVCNCIWLHRNHIIFNNQKSDPTKVIFHQKALLQRIA